MKKILLAVNTILFLAVIVATVHAESVIVGSDSTLIVDGDVYTLKSQPPNYTGLMWEEEQGAMKVCGCGAQAFRAMQAMAAYLGMDEFSRSIAIKTGWSTDGAEEMSVGKMGWINGVNFSYGEAVTDPDYLTLQDAWYRFTVHGRTFLVTSDAHNYRFTPDPSHPGHHEGWSFFDYRTYAKTHATGPEKAYFKDVVRPQFISNLMGETVFDVSLEVRAGRYWK